jgi:hypothetical protein
VNKVCCVVGFFFFFSFVSKRFQNDSTMTSEPLDVFSVFLLMLKLWGFVEHNLTLKHAYRMYIC